MFQTPYLHIYGYICNVGTDVAYDSKLHIVAYQSGGVIAKETDIILGTIAGKLYVPIDASIYYSSPILSYEIILYWQGGKTQYTVTTLTKTLPSTTFVTTTVITTTITTTTTKVP